MAKRRELPKRYFRRVYSATAAAPSSEHRIQWSKERKALNGFPLHVMGLFIRATVTYSTVAATMAGTCPQWRLWNFISSFFFGIGNHTFFRNLSGARVFHDQRQMFGAGPYGELATIADADATNTTAVIEMYVPFALPQPAEGAEWDGAIPMEALRDEDMVFTLGASGGLGFAGVTWSAVTFEVLADVVPLHQLRVPTAWQVVAINDTRTEFSKSFGPGFLYYLDVFDPELQETPALSATQYPSLTLSIGDGLLEQQDTTLLYSAFNRARKELNLAANLLTATPAGTSEYIPLIMPYWRDLVTRQPMGDVRLNVPARTLASTTLQTRTRGTTYSAYLADMFERLGVPADVIDRNKRGAEGQLDIELRAAKKGRAPSWLHKHLDMSIRWPSMPYQGVLEVPG